jgi:hypothetical protein
MTDLMDSLFTGMTDTAAPMMPIDPLFIFSFSAISARSAVRWFSLIFRAYFLGQSQSSMPRFLLESAWLFPPEHLHGGTALAGRLATVPRISGIAPALTGIRRIDAWPFAKTGAKNENVRTADNKMDLINLHPINYFRQVY